MKFIQNPVLKGFNPDPSILRVGDDYYLATSTFEWFPGVQIHHSRNLRQWQLVARPLDRLSLLDLRGNPDSCGVWAPCLTHEQGTFYLVYSNVRSFDGVWKDVHNYLITTDTPLGKWSEPVYLNSSGFDPSLFHDEDGRKWLVNMLADHRQGKLFGGIVLQEYDPNLQKLVGPVHHIFDGTGLSNVEAPHLYQRNGYYYLMTAEGGTEYRHCITLARSRTITGPYEVHPHNPILTAKDHPDLPLQKAGHGDLVETREGSWYLAYLCGRPLSPRGRCTLGRETALAAVEWREDDWLYVKETGGLPALEVAAPDLPDMNLPAEPAEDGFDAPHLSQHFQALRVPISEDWCTLSERPGFLRLYGRESLSSFHAQSLLARRVADVQFEAWTRLEFHPTNFQQLAGLVCYYNTGHFHYLYLSVGDAEQQRLLHILSCDHYRMEEPLEAAIPLQGQGPVDLKVVWRGEALQFYAAEVLGSWRAIGPVLDGSILSDDYVMYQDDRYRPAFTGAFVGLCCQDLSGQRLHADFDCFGYRPRS